MPDKRTGLLLDWGGVMTTDLFGSFRAFCESEGIDSDLVVRLFRHDDEARDLLIAFEEGTLEEADFERAFAAKLGTSPDALVDRMFAGSGIDQAMLDMVRHARRHGVKTGLISNSWGTARYPHDLLAELFDGIVLSGDEGMRKPAPRMYELGAERIGLEPAACVFVDDLPFNLKPAEELGMAVVHHTSATQTISELEALLQVPLAPTD